MKRNGTYCRLELELSKLAPGTHSIAVNFFDANSQLKETLFTYEVSVEILKLEATVEKCHKM